MVSVYIAPILLPLIWRVVKDKPAELAPPVMVPRLMQRLETRQAACQQTVRYELEGH